MNGAQRNSALEVLHKCSYGDDAGFFHPYPNLLASKGMGLMQFSQVGCYG